MKTFADLIDKWPSQPEFAADIGSTPGAVKQMRRRDSVPSEYWLGIVSGAARRGYAGITYESLAEIAASGRPAICEPSSEAAQ